MHDYNQQKILGELNQVAKKYPQITPFITHYTNEGYGQALDWLIQYQPKKWGIFEWNCKGAEGIFKVLQRNKILLPDINEMADHFGKTPLHKAALGENVYVYMRMVEYLDADPGLKDNSGIVALAYMYHNRPAGRHRKTLYGETPATGALPIVIFFVLLIGCILFIWDTDDIPKTRYKNDDMYVGVPQESSVDRANTKNAPL